MRRIGGGGGYGTALDSRLMNARKLLGWLGALLFLAGLLAAMLTGNWPLGVVIFGLGAVVLGLVSRERVVG